MKIFHLSSQFATTSFSLLNRIKAIKQRFVRALTCNSELQVWQKTDRYGNNYWQARDPKTDKSTSLSSEAEMRIWIEQRYYQ